MSLPKIPDISRSLSLCPPPPTEFLSCRSHWYFLIYIFSANRDVAELRAVTTWYSCARSGACYRSSSDTRSCVPYIYIEQLICMELNLMSRNLVPYSSEEACPTRRPWYTFLAPYFTLPALTLIRIPRIKYFWITVCFSFFRTTLMNTFFPLLLSCFLRYPLYCPLTPPFLFTGESAGISSHPFKQITHLSRLCFEEPVTIIVGVS
jgi:hypothetical protein